MQNKIISFTKRWYLRW